MYNILSLFRPAGPNMSNETTPTFIMTAYTSIGNYKYGLFVIFLLLYLFIMAVNTLLISVIHQNKDLHQPMNIFMCLLSVNEMYGSTALLPSIMHFLMARMHESSVRWCLAQVYFLHTYGASEFSILALMGYDRYLAICDPLHYQNIMSQSRMAKLVAFTVLYPFLLFAGFYSLTLRLSFCGRVIPKLYCVNMELVKNSCSSVSYISILGLALIMAFVVPQLLLILFSYVQISRVCWKLKKESRRNALRTCVPHLLSLLNYTIGSLFEIAQTRIDMSDVIAEFQILLSLYFIVITPVANSVLYGLGTQIIRVHLMKLFLRHRILPAKSAKQRFQPEHRQSHVTCQKH